MNFEWNKSKILSVGFQAVLPIYMQTLNETKCHKLKFILENQKKKKSAGIMSFKKI